LRWRLPSPCKNRGEHELAGTCQSGVGTARARPRAVLRVGHRRESDTGSAAWLRLLPVQRVDRAGQRLAESQFVAAGQRGVHRRRAGAVPRQMGCDSRTGPGGSSCPCGRPYQASGRPQDPHTARPGSPRRSRSPARTGSALQRQEGHQRDLPRRILRGRVLAWHGTVPDGHGGQPAAGARTDRNHAATSA